VDGQAGSGRSGPKIFCTQGKARKGKQQSLPKGMKWKEGYRINTIFTLHKGGKKRGNREWRDILKLHTEGERGNVVVENYSF